MEDEMKKVTLEELHNDICNFPKTEYLDGYEITDLDGNEDPKLLEDFKQKFEIALKALNEADLAFHELWDCR